MDLIDISSPRVGIVKLWVGEFLIFFMSVYNHYLTSHVSWGGGELSFFLGGGGGRPDTRIPTLCLHFSQLWANH